MALITFSFLQRWVDTRTRENDETGKRSTGVIEKAYFVIFLQFNDTLHMIM